VTFRECGATVFQRVALALAVGVVTNGPYHCGKRVNYRGGNDRAKAVSIYFALAGLRQRPR
jgi:hypothetical protein